MNTGSRKKITNAIIIFGFVMVLAGTVLVISHQSFGGLDGLLSTGGALLLIFGGLTRRHEQQSSEEDGKTNMSPDSIKKQAIGTVLLVFGSILAVAAGVAVFSEIAGFIFYSVGILGGLMIVIQGARMKLNARTSQQSEVLARTRKE